MNNRNSIKSWSLTFPQTEVGREEFAKSFPPYEEVICSREEHKEGGYHLHLGIKLLKGITKVNMLKWIRVKYPGDYKRIDVQATRSIRCWTDYISKEDVNRFQERNESSRLKMLSKWKIETPNMGEVCTHLDCVESAERTEEIMLDMKCSGCDFGCIFCCEWRKSSKK